MTSMCIYYTSQTGQCLTSLWCAEIGIQMYLPSDLIFFPYPEMTLDIKWVYLINSYAKEESKVGFVSSTVSYRHIGCMQLTSTHFWNYGTRWIWMIIFILVVWLEEGGRKALGWNLGRSGVTQGVCHVAVYRSVVRILTLLSVSDFGYFLTNWNFICLCKFWSFFSSEYGFVSWSCGLWQHFVTTQFSTYLLCDTVWK